jgi:membrane protease YdiL (CAAX protease family)
MLGYILAAAWRGTSPSPDEPALASSVGGLMSDTLVALLVFGVPFAIGVFLTKPCRDDLYLRLPKNWLLTCTLGAVWSIVLRLAIMVPAAIVAGVVIFLNPQDGLNQFAANRPKIENLLDPNALANPLYALVCMTWLSFVVAGLREELWRAAVIRGICTLGGGFLSERKLECFAVFVSSLLFGLAHLTQGWLGVLLTSLLGLGLGLIQILRRSLPEAVLAHGFFDASTFFLIFLLQQKDLLARMGINSDLMKQVFPR